MSKEANSSKSNKKKRRHSTILPYITTPLIFVLISMVVIAPMCFVGMNFAIDTVHSAQKVLARDFNDVEANLDYEGSSKTDGSVSIPKLSTSQKLGVITCENAGLYADVFYGINRVSLRNGVGLESDSALCGMGKNVEIYGYASSGFKALGNVKNGDIIGFETLWGAYSYQVEEIAVLENAPKKSGKEYLVLATDEDKNAFSSFNKDKLYVVARKLTGPASKEVLE